MDQKKMIIDASFLGGRKKYLEVAELMDMPPKTADNIVIKFRRKGNEATLDHRHEGHVVFTKKTEYHVRSIQEMLHWNSTLTLRQIKDDLNWNSLRSVLREEKIPLFPEDQSSDKLKVAEYLEQYPGIVSSYKRVEITSVQTIANWLNGMIYTSKVVVHEKLTANTERAMASRLRYASYLKTQLLDMNYYIVFIDEMPFYLKLSRSFGRAPKGKRAVVKTAPYSDFSFRTQVAMAVNSEDGLIFGARYPPTVSQAVKKNGTLGKPALRPSWDKSTFGSTWMA